MAEIRELQPVKTFIPPEIMVKIAEKCIDEPFDLNITMGEYHSLEQCTISQPQVAKLMSTSKSFHIGIRRGLIDVFSGTLNIRIDDELSDSPTSALPSSVRESPPFLHWARPYIRTVVFTVPENDMLPLDPGWYAGSQHLPALPMYTLTTDDHAEFQT